MKKKEKETRLSLKSWKVGFGAPEKATQQGRRLHGQVRPWEPEKVTAHKLNKLNYFELFRHWSASW